MHNYFDNVRSHLLKFLPLSPPPSSPSFSLLSDTTYARTQTCFCRYVMKHFQNTPNYTCLRHRISQVIGSVKCQTNLREHEGEQERLSARSESVHACVQVQDCVRFVFFS